MKGHNMANIYGWTGAILRINLSNGEVQTQSMEPYVERFIGGRGIISKLYWDEVSEKVDALHPDSPLMFMTGPLAGSGAIACSRWFVAGKSPLQYPDQFGLANVGGVRICTETDLRTLFENILETPLPAGTLGMIASELARCVEDK